MARGSCCSIYFRRALTLDDVEARLRAGPFVVRREGDVLCVAWPREPPEARVRLDVGEPCATSARRLAASHDIALLEGCDRRLRIELPDLEAALVQTNTLAELELSLGDLVDGFVHHEWNGLFAPREGVPEPRPRLTLDALARTLDRELDALRAEAKTAGVEAPLDLSYESLDALEDALFALVPDDAEPRAWRGLRDRATRYVGATLIARRGGRWAVGGSAREGAPVVEVPSLPKTRPFEPMGPVLNAVRLRVPGRLRDDTERWDLPRRRARLAELLARRDEELARFAEDVAELTGEKGAVLDRSADGLGLVQRAIVRSIEIDAPRDRRRRLRERAVLHLGTLHAPSASTEWSLREKPAYADFGEILVGDWCPAESLRAIGPSAPPGRLAERVGVSDARSRAKARRPKP